MSILSVILTIFVLSGSVFAFAGLTSCLFDLLSVFCPSLSSNAV